MPWAQWCLFILQLWVVLGAVIHDGKRVTIQAKHDVPLRIGIFLLMMAAGAFSKLF